MQNIEALMTTDLILFDLKCADREDCIRQMAERLLAEGRITALEPYVEAVMERERLGVTGIGMQVAIPHGKSSAVRTPWCSRGATPGWISGQWTAAWRI